jgi:hypothetical protein
MALVTARRRGKPAPLLDTRGKSNGTKSARMARLLQGGGRASNARRTGQGRHDKGRSRVYLAMGKR